ncbi:MAG: heme-binding protein [Moraxellaceae bacterium]|nr:heme-binding protein [Moraxellaceae bacterium]
MTITVPRLKLTHEGALLLLNAAVAKALEMNTPQCIAVVDDGCNLLAYLRMDGAKVLSMESTLNKAVTAASDRKPTGEMDHELGTKLALATRGRKTHLKGGLPIIVDGQVIGGIAAGSGTGEQDRIVANAGLAAFAGAQVFDYV